MPHLNLTTTTATTKEIHSQINTPTVSYADIYGFHGDSLLLLWNILLSIAVLYLLFHNRFPGLTVILQAAPINATDKVTYHHDILFWTAHFGECYFCNILYISAPTVAPS